MVVAVVALVVLAAVEKHLQQLVHRAMVVLGFNG
jgi:hypothetical protein